MIGSIAQYVVDPSKPAGNRHARATENKCGVLWRQGIAASRLALDLRVARGGEEVEGQEQACERDGDKKRIHGNRSDKERADELAQQVVSRRSACRRHKNLGTGRLCGSGGVLQARGIRPGDVKRYTKGGSNVRNELSRPARSRQATTLRAGSVE